MPTAPFVRPKPRTGPIASLDDIDGMLEDTPLFMRSLPDGEENEMLQALQSLVFDGSANDQALNFKSQGNDYFTGRKFRDALGFYTQGIDVKPEDHELLATLLSNRAACNLALENNRQVLLDIAKALSLGPLPAPTTIKCLYRSSLALLATSRYDECIDACDRALKVEGGATNKAVQEVRAKAVQRAEDARIALARKTERERREKGLKSALQVGYKLRGLKVISTPSPPSNATPPIFDPLPDHSQDSIPLVPNSPAEQKWIAPDPATTPISFPTFFLYPQYATSDFVSGLSEQTPLLEMLCEMFPSSPTDTEVPFPEWDKEKKYHLANLQVYTQSHYMSILKIPKKFTLEKVFQAAREGSIKGDGIELKDGMLSLVVLVKGPVEDAWVEMAKKRRDEMLSKK